MFVFFFFQAEDGIRDYKVTGVQTCALPICESVGDASDAFGCESFGLNGFRREALCRGGKDGTPAAIGDGDNGGAMIAPRNGRGGFEASVGEMGSRHGTVLAKDANYTRPVLALRV